MAPRHSCRSRCRPTRYKLPARCDDRWLVAACCFTLAAFLFTGQVWVDYAYAGRSLSWPRAFAVALVDWELWTLIAPIVLLLAARVPLSRRRLAMPLAVHIPASLGIAVVKLVAEAMIVRAIIGPGRVPFSLLKIHLTLLTYWAIVAAVQYAEQHRLARERELQAARLQTELARAQVEALKMQIHPHFLFNTLNAIAGLMREDVESADVMLAQLSELLRGTLQTEGVQEVPLAEELRLLRALPGDPADALRRPAAHRRRRRVPGARRASCRR